MSLIVYRVLLCKMNAAKLGIDGFKRMSKTTTHFLNNEICLIKCRITFKEKHEPIYILLSSFRDGKKWQECPLLKFCGIIK